MLNYAQIKNKPRIFQSLTGLTQPAFARLVIAFQRAYERDAQRETPRQRRRGGGRKAVLATAEDKLVFILFYFKFYPTQEVLGFLFGLGQPQANEWIHRLTPILNAALGYESSFRRAKRRIWSKFWRLALVWSSSLMGQSGQFSGPKIASGSGSITAARRSAIQSRTS